MNFNQELYKEFIQKKRAKQNPSSQKHHQKRRQILKLFLQLDNDEPITLESSITIFKKLQILHTIQGVDHIVTIMQRKKKQLNQWNGNQQQLLQCRLIYFLWAVIDDQTIQVRQFKEIILILIDQQNKSNRIERIKNIYEDKQGIDELIQCWDKIIKESYHMDSNHSQSQEEISNISIIKSKNQGTFDSNKENISYFQEEELKNSRNTKSNHKANHYSIHPKTFQRKQSKQKLNRSGSINKIQARKSITTTLASTSANIPKSNFFTTSNENLSFQQQKQLIKRLYNFNKYKERQQLKKIIQKQRLQAQLNHCSFKPNLEDRSRVMSKSKINTKQVKGYQKAIERMKIGYKINKQLKENLQYRIWKMPYNGNKINRFSAPKFLNRTKEVSNQLFQIVFTIGRHNIRIKIKESDKISDIVNNIGQIYSLKESNKNYIRSIIEEELSNYYENKCKYEDNDGEEGQN